MRFEMSIDARGGIAHWQKLDLGETWDVNWYNMRNNYSPKFRFKFVDHALPSVFVSCKPIEAKIPELLL